MSGLVLSREYTTKVRIKCMLVDTHNSIGTNGISSLLDTNIPNTWIASHCSLGYVI